MSFHAFPPHAVAWGYLLSPLRGCLLVHLGRPGPSLWPPNHEAHEAHEADGGDGRDGGDGGDGRDGRDGRDVSARRWPMRERFDGKIRVCVHPAWHENAVFFDKTLDFWVYRPNRLQLSLVYDSAAKGAKGGSTSIDSAPEMIRELTPQNLSNAIWP